MHMVGWACVKELWDVLASDCAFIPDIFVTSMQAPAGSS